MILWRISNHRTLDGAGGLLAPARWHSKGRPVVYLAETPAGALTEALVHLEIKVGRMPLSYRLMKVRLREESSVASVEQRSLPADWRENLTATRTIGDEWLAKGSTLLLRVPSAIVPESFNYLLNPRHSEASSVEIIEFREHPWDKRLLT